MLTKVETVPHSNKQFVLHKIPCGGENRKPIFGIKPNNYDNGEKP